MFFFVQAALDSPDRYPQYSSQESLYGYKNRIYTPPVIKPQNNVFFNSDDSLYKTETRKLTIPRIEIEPSEPIFRLEITDFSEPNPTNVTLCGEIDNDATRPLEKLTKTWKNKANNYVQQKSFSLDIKDIPYIDSSTTDIDQFLNTKLHSTSLQDLSSSTSSLNSGIHESNLDLSQDTPVKEKNWKSPSEYRKGNVKILTKRFEDIFGDRIVLTATSYPNLTILDRKDRKEKRSLDSLNKKSDKLNDIERMEILRVLEDWSLNGSNGIDFFNCDKNINNSKNNLNNNNNCLANDDKLQSDCENSALRRRNGSMKKQRALEMSSNENLSEIDSKRKFSQAYSKYFKTNINVNQQFHNDNYSSCKYNKKETNLRRANKKFNSESDLLTKKKRTDGPIFIMKYKSESNLTDDDLNKNLDMQFFHDCQFRNCIFNKNFLHIRNDQNYAGTKNNNDKNTNFSNLKRCGSLERLKINNNNNDYDDDDDDDEVIKKFPDSYIVRKSNRNNNKILVRRKFMGGGKSWKSCSDIKRQNVVQKCCKNAKKSCPILINNMMTTPTLSKRKTQSCDSFDDCKFYTMEIYSEDRKSIYDFP